MFGALNIRDTVRPAAEGKGTTGMLPTFVIGLREGVEAALIVGIIAAFLIQRGERKAIRSMWLGVAIAIALCIGVAVVLSVIGENLPFKQREIMEGVLALIAVAGVTYMIVWMRRHSRGLKGVLEENAAAALVAGSSLALIGMAFFAVIREGLETAIFMLAAFQNSTDPMATGLGAVIGVVVAVALGYAIYKGGVRINLSRFFRITGFVLVLVAAGLLASAVHSLSEAGVVTQLQIVGLRPDLAGGPGQRPGRPPHRHAGPAAGAHHRRDVRLAPLRHPHGRLRPVASAIRSQDRTGGRSRHHHRLRAIVPASQTICPRPQGGVHVARPPDHPRSHLEPSRSWSPQAPAAAMTQTPRPTTPSA